MLLKFTVYDSHHQGIDLAVSEWLDVFFANLIVLSDLQTLLFVLIYPLCTWLLIAQRA